MKTCSTPFVIKEMKIKTMRYYYTPIRKAEIQMFTLVLQELVMMWNRNLKGCCWEQKMGQPLGKTVWQFLIKPNIILSYNKAIMLLAYLTKGTENLHLYKHLHANVYGSFIHSGQNLEAIKITSVDEWINKPVVHPDDRILFISKKKWMIKPWKDMKELKCELLSEANMKRLYTVWFQL